MMSHCTCRIILGIILISLSYWFGWEFMTTEGVILVRSKLANDATILRIPDGHLLSAYDFFTVSNLGPNNGQVVLSNASSPDGCSPDVNQPPDVPDGRLGADVVWILLAAHSTNCSLNDKINNIANAGYSGFILTDFGSNSSYENLTEYQEYLSSSESKNTYISFIGGGDGELLKKYYSYPSDPNFTFSVSIAASNSWIVAVGLTVYIGILFVIGGTIILTTFCSLLMLCCKCIGWSFKSIVRAYKRCRSAIKTRLHHYNARNDVPPPSSSSLSEGVIDWFEKNPCTSCVICLENFTTCGGDGNGDANDGITVLSCSHAFHEDCINTWLSSSNRSVCPLCQRSVPRPPPANERLEEENTEQTPLLSSTRRSVNPNTNTNSPSQAQVPSSLTTTNITLEGESGNEIRYQYVRIYHELFGYLILRRRIDPTTTSNVTMMGSESSDGEEGRGDEEETIVISRSNGWELFD